MSGMLHQVTLDDQDYVVEADFEPGQSYNRGQPEVTASFDVGGIWGADGITPIKLSDEDIDRIEQILLQRRQTCLDADRYDQFCSRFEE